MDKPDKRWEDSIEEEGLLIKRCQRGEWQAFEELVERKRQRIFWIAYQITGDEEGALDITQEIFIKLWKGIGRFQRGRKFDTWLYRMVVNGSVDFLRKKKRAVGGVFVVEGMAEELPSIQPNAEKKLLIKELQEIFNYLASRLPPKQRAAFVLREIHGFSIREIAKIMRATQSTIRNNLWLAKQFLREQMERHFPEYITWI
ncbi:MAG: RNA polymerase sigma factor [Candidatus Aminicenantes bacterium]|nr:RNA polymerase sigma factor [Candidatus Aminicenantes bacterium]MDH5714977.1 RNA polymerase sigma factor [Candidatus Aminicenantes bacterium]